MRIQNTMNLPRAIFRENSCHFMNFAHLSKQVFVSQLEIYHVIQEPRAKRQEPRAETRGHLDHLCQLKTDETITNKTVKIFVKKVLFDIVFLSLNTMIKEV